MCFKISRYIFIFNAVWIQLNDFEKKCIHCCCCWFQGNRPCVNICSPATSSVVLNHAASSSDSTIHKIDTYTQFRSRLLACLHSLQQQQQPSRMVLLNRAYVRTVIVLYVYIFSSQLSKTFTIFYRQKCPSSSLALKSAIMQ